MRNGPKLGRSPEIRLTARNPAPRCPAPKWRRWESNPRKVPPVAPERLWTLTPQARGDRTGVAQPSGPEERPSPAARSWTQREEVGPGHPAGRAVEAGTPARGGDQPRHAREPMSTTRPGVDKPHAQPQ